MPIAEPGPKFGRGDLVDVQGTSVHPTFRGVIQASHRPQSMWGLFSYTVKVVNFNPSIAYAIGNYRVVETNITYAPAIDRLGEIFNA